MTIEQFNSLPTLARVRRISSGRIYIVTGTRADPFLESGSDTRFVCGWGHTEKNGRPFGRVFSIVPDDFDFVQQ